MALMVGTGPFSRRPAGTFNFSYDAPDGVLYFEESPRRVRVVIAGETVADSVEVKLLHETGQMPVYYFPQRDARTDLLEPSAHTTHCPFKGVASYWTVHAGGQTRDDAVWSYLEPIAGAPPLAGHVAFAWDAVDEWWEEAERVGVHPRDPYHRCDVVRSDRHVIVRVSGQIVADSDQPMMLFETGLPPRFYLSVNDVHLDLLEPSDTVTRCPYKGTTSRHFTAVIEGRRVEDVAWVYDDPHAEVDGIAGLVAFYNEKVELEVDGEIWQRPRTKFSDS